MTGCLTHSCEDFSVVITLLSFLKCQFNKCYKGNTLSLLCWFEKASLTSTSVPGICELVWPSGKVLGW